MKRRGFLAMLAAIPAAAIGAVMGVGSKRLPLAFRDSNRYIPCDHSGLVLGDSIHIPPKNYTSIYTPPKNFSGVAGSDFKIEKRS